MALTLPSFTIDDPVKEQRLLDAFRPPMGTTAQAAAEYRRWLRAALIREVEHRERIKAAQTLLEAGDLLPELNPAP